MLYAAPLEDVIALDSEQALEHWLQRDPLHGDLRLFLSIARDLVVFSDNHGEFMVTANGDFKTDHRRARPLHAAPTHPPAPPCGGT